MYDVYAEIYFSQKLITIKLEHHIFVAESEKDVESSRVTPGLNIKFWVAEKEMHVEFTNKCVVCMEKHILVQNSLQLG